MVRSAMWYGIQTYEAAVCELFVHSTIVFAATKKKPNWVFLPACLHASLTT